jgi:hypothetical protein
MTKLQERTEELNELLNYAASIAPRISEATERRIGWLKNNLNTPETKEEREIASEWESHMASKTLSFYL